MIPIFNGSLTVFLVAIIFSYLLGAVPFGLIIARLMRLGNLRHIGSGNIGATNVLRTGNCGAAALTLVLDMGKGAVVVFLVRISDNEFTLQAAALAVFLGHCFPLWLEFKGGKGVATFIGVSLMLFWPAGVAICLVWLGVAFAFRISSLAALVACISGVLWMYSFGATEKTGLMLVLATLIWLRHKSNIINIFNRKEPRIGQ